MRSVLLAATAVVCASCATSRWVNSNPAIGPEQAGQDQRVCEYQAKLATPDQRSGLGVGNAIGDGISQGMRLGELQRMCMEIKGYVRVQAQ